MVPASGPIIPSRRAARRRRHDRGAASARPRDGAPAGLAIPEARAQAIPALRQWPGDSAIVVAEALSSASS